MAYYNTIKNLLNNGKTFAGIYSAVNGAAINNISLNDKFTIGDYILISSSGGYYDNTTKAYINNFNVTGCKKVFQSTINSNGGAYSISTVVYIGQVLETNITVTNISANIASSQIRFYRLSNNS